MMNLKFYPATPSRWPDLERLFGERGACGGCWCMAWRLRNKDWIAGKGAKNKRALKKIILAGEKPGILGYKSRQPIAWCAVAPREKYGALQRSRVLKPVDDQPVWSISCFFILKTFRRMGLSTRLLQEAVNFAAKQGASIVEGYPIQPSMQRTPDPFIWTVVPSAFEKAGFKEVARRSKSRPIMRYAIRNNSTPKVIAAK
jgi:GNAT superfamily N-acetyltransferase